MAGTSNMIGLVNSPPSFDEAKLLRQQARAAGMDPNYWYAVEQVKNVKPESVTEIIFWKRSIALVRSEDGTFHAFDNRCAHRQIKLSLGHVEGCNLICAYHGWTYDQDGKCVEIPHAHFGRSFPDVTIRTYPVKVRYGIVWLFPGDPALAEQREIPVIPELEGEGRWACVPLVFTWKAHHSMVIDNVSDFTHAHLHRRYRPFDGADLVRCETIDDSVHVAYDSDVGRGPISGRFVEHGKYDTSHIDLCYEYPYQWSNTDEAIKHWLFVLPINESTTRVFFLFYFKSLKIPWTPIRFPRSLMTAVMKLSNRWLIGPLLDQDRFAVEAEQEGYENHAFDQPIELNPAVPAFQRLTVRKWQDYISREAEVEAHGH